MGQDIGWEHFPHVADIGVHGWGPTLSEAFQQAALALTAVVTDPSLVRPSQKVPIRCREADPELLLMDWLNTLVYEMATRKMLFSRFRVAVDAEGLAGEAWGEPVEIPRHQPAVEVKGATVTGLEVSCQTDGTWHARCVVDV